MKSKSWPLGLACIFGSSLVASPLAFASETTTYTYDVHGRLVEVNVVDADDSGGNNGVKVVYAYDDAHNRIKKTVTGA